MLMAAGWCAAQYNADKGVQFYDAMVGIRTLARKPEPL
jgi:hypothetical protein